MADWLHSNAATVVSGASVISFTGNLDLSSVRGGDVVMVNGQIWECQSGTRPDNAGVSTITLARPWPYSGASNASANIFRTTHDLLRLSSDARKLTDITKGLLNAQKDILTATTPTIDVPVGVNPTTGETEVLQVTPWQYIINQVNASLGNIAAIGAMSQVQFEAMRDYNRRLYVASGMVDMGLHGDDNINEGLYTDLTTPNVLMMGGGTKGTSKNAAATIHIAGVLFELSQVNTPKANACMFKFGEAPDGKTTYKHSGSNAGEVKHHSSVTDAFNYAALDPDNIDVVTRRVDMYGVEAWAELVTSANPLIYPNACINSQAATMNGVATTRSNRPDTYYGEHQKRGVGVDYFSLSDAGKKAVLSDPKNNLYFTADGQLVQWRCRLRSINGAGNGDWEEIDSSTVAGGATLIFDISAASTRVQVQSSHNIPNADIVSQFYAATSNPSYNADPQQGVFTSRHAFGNGEPSYFLVCGVVPRMNIASYHPAHNPFGSADALVPGVARFKWHSSKVDFNSEFDCFGDSGDGRPVYDGSGYLGTTSGRSNVRFYDVIYAEGLGGVIDFRLPARDMSSAEEASKIQAEVERGAYRGKEKLTWISNIETTAVNGSRTDSGLFTFLATTTDNKYDWIARSGITPAHGHFVVNGNSRKVVGMGRHTDGLQLIVYVDKPFTSANGEIAQGCFGYYGDTSVSGAFEQLEVIAPPTRILEIKDLKKGWLGSWSPDIPIDGATFKRLTRKAVGNLGAISLHYTDDDGSNWASGGTDIDGVTNTIAGVSAAIRVGVFPYTAFAKQTKESSNKPVLNGKQGVGCVSSFSGYFNPTWGCLFMEALLGKIGVSNSSAGLKSSPILTSVSIRNDSGILDASNSRLNAHSSLTLGSPANNSSGFKVLDHQIVNNGKLSLGYQANELTYGFKRPIRLTVGGALPTYKAGDVFLFPEDIQNTSIAGDMFVALSGGSGISNIPANWYRDYQWGKNNQLISNNDNSVSPFAYKYVGSAAGWGDDSTMKIVNGTSIFIDLNGNANLAVSHELAIPYGYTRQQ